ncbi:MAG TPA: NF038122 family metalloprotease [Thermoanaerobaculia bacterium]|nr:NF038122 family metalloprotease [Thermoanaerobaculia bacterium]
MKTRYPLILILLLVPLIANAQSAREALALPMHDHGAYVVREAGGRTFCADATPEEALRITARPRVPLRVFGESHDKVRANASAGLNIILRGTAQLDANPQAKAAFARAADVWESRIANPITVYVDVDFGEERFGEEFPEGVIAAANADYRGAEEGLYNSWRGLLIARADNAAETAVYNSLPTGSLPTDLGNTTLVAAPSILLRTISWLGGTAQGSDDAPSIGFNSEYDYDFDPSNGITPGLTDFEGVVVHEIGHMLGFASLVGLSELDLEIPAIPTVFDFFRFRPGVTSGTFSSAQRVQSSGGDQVFFANGTALPLSTGRPDGTGGDENQASHWKDDALSGVYIGIMDPTISPSVRTEITNNDLAAFGMMGYNIVAPNAGCQESEPNETTANASPISLGTPCTGNANSTEAAGIIVDYGDGDTDGIEDLFRLTLTAPARLNVNLTFPSGDLDLFLLTINGSNVQVVGVSNETTSPEGFITSAILPAGTYYVGISAYSGSSSYTVTVSAEGTVLQPPAAPSNLTATATSTSSIRLNWVDNSNDEAEFRIEQRIGGNFVDIGSVPANATSFTVTGLASGQTFTFRIRARNGNGDSLYSNEASATTQVPTGPCVANATTVCLLSDRFRVSIAFINQFANPPAPGNFLGAKLVAGVQNPDVATFGISSAQAIEVVVRIQDTRPFGLNRFDVYYGGLTDLEYTVTVTDTVTGTTRTYRNPPGTVGGGVDRTSFISN